MPNRGLTASALTPLIDPEFHSLVRIPKVGSSTATYSAYRLAKTMHEAGGSVMILNKVSSPSRLPTLLQRVPPSEKPSFYPHLRIVQRVHHERILWRATRSNWEAQRCCHSSLSAWLASNGEAKTRCWIVCLAREDQHWCPMQACVSLPAKYMRSHHRKRAASSTFDFQSRWKEASTLHGTWAD